MPSNIQKRERAINISGDKFGRIFNRLVDVGFRLPSA